ncbi:MAG: transketolase [Helicobacteraceae bacterium]|nr:transketolase [Helicobacteraceae bacterium]
MRNTAAKEISNYCKNNENGFLIAGDAGFGVWDAFQKELPTQYINPGINEQATIGLASGMALSGHKVFYYNIIPFVLMRCYEQVRLDIAYHNLPIVLIGIGSGITYAPAGMTHYSVEDIALAKTIPNLNIISPSDPVQVQKAVAYAIESDKPTYIRISRSGEPIIFDDNIDIKKPIYLKRGAKQCLLFHGSIVDEVLKASEKLDEVSVISVPMISPIDVEKILEILNKYEDIFVVEEHFKDGGLGTIISDIAVKHNVYANIVKIAIDNEYIHKIGNCDYLRKELLIDSESIVNIVKDK